MVNTVMPKKLYGNKYIETGLTLKGHA